MLIIKQNGVQLIDHDYEKHLFSQAGLFDSFGLQKGQFVTGFDWLMTSNFNWSNHV